MQSRGRAAIDSAGNFVIVWDSGDQDGEGLGVFGQRFDAAGNKLGPSFPSTRRPPGINRRRTSG
jgi:hypothetical protein